MKNFLKNYSWLMHAAIFILFAAFMFVPFADYNTNFEAHPIYTLKPFTMIDDTIFAIKTHEFESLIKSEFVFFIVALIIFTMWITAIILHKKFAFINFVIPSFPVFFFALCFICAIHYTKDWINSTSYYIYLLCSLISIFIYIYLLIKAVKKHCAHHQTKLQRISELEQRIEKLENPDKKD